VKIGYYPGCSFHGAEKRLDKATQIVAKEFGIELIEVQDWNCCGGGFLQEENEEAMIALNVRNLALLESMGLKKMVTPCSVCLLSLRKAEKIYKADKVIKRKVDEKVGEKYKYSGEGTTEHFIWILIREIGVEKIREKVKRPLRGLKVGAYYGCQYLRPREYLGFEDPYRPSSLENLIKALGAEPVSFPEAYSCCGFPSLGSNERNALTLSKKVLESAKTHGADLIISPCPLCNIMLDGYQGRIKREFRLNWSIPVLYASQLIALALGYSYDELEMDKNLIKASQVLREKGLL